MVRLFGGVLVVAAGVMIGYFAGQWQKDKLEKQELLYNYLDCICCELKYFSSPLDLIAKKLLQRTAFINFDFAAQCARAIDNQPFSRQFEVASEQNISCLGAEICADLKLLASRLGTESLEAQLSALNICMQSIRQTIEYERPKVMQNVKLLRSLGTFAGMGVLILFW